MSGNIALLMLPTDQRLHVQFSQFFYAFTLAKLRSAIAGSREGIAVFEIATPTNAPTVQVAIDRRSLYVLGFRGMSGGWWTFRDPGKLIPVLPGAATNESGLNGTYTELGLPNSINMAPDDLLNELAGYDGAPDASFAKAVVLLLFLTSEALRFDDVLMECVRYFQAGTSYAYTLHPARYAATVRNWKNAGEGNRNVLLPYLGADG